MTYRNRFFLIPVSWYTQMEWVWFLPPSSFPWGRAGLWHLVLMCWPFPLRICVSGLSGDSQCFAGILSNFCFSQNWTTFEVKSHGTFLPLQVQSDQAHTVFIKKHELTLSILSEFNGADESAYHSPLKCPIRYIKLDRLHNMMVMQYD